MKLEIGHYQFLNYCFSKPLTLADLKVGDKFVIFPDDGDDHGHGGFQGGGVIHKKIEPYHPSGPYDDSYVNTCADLRGWASNLPLSTYVYKVVE